MVKDYTNDGKWKELKVTGVEFIRRFLMHVPPKRFVRIRHYGILSTRTKSKKMTFCRNLLGCRKYISVLKEMNTVQILQHLFGINICRYKDCGGKLLKKSTGRSYSRCKT